MRSKIILVVHTVFFLSFATASLASPFLMAYYPRLFTGKGVIVGFSAFALLAAGSWPLYGGECPFTVWEHTFLKREGKRAYKGACINHYADKWFGMRLHRHAGTVILVVLFLVPMVVGFIRW